jgi:hypothetical protein
MTNNDPGAASSGGPAVGIRYWQVPKASTNKDDGFLLNAPATRSDGDWQRNSMSYSFAGFISSTASAAYNTYTKITWAPESTGCPAGNAQYLWGQNQDVANTWVVESDCFLIGTFTG